MAETSTRTGLPLNVPVPELLSVLENGYTVIATATDLAGFPHILAVRKGPASGKAEYASWTWNTDRGYTHTGHYRDACIIDAADDFGRRILT